MKAKTKTLFSHKEIFPFYEIKVSETEKSYIIIERTGVTGRYDKICRFKKTEYAEMVLQALHTPSPRKVFARMIDTRENGAYWQSWSKVE